MSELFRRPTVFLVTLFVSAASCMLDYLFEGPSINGYLADSITAASLLATGLVAAFARGFTPIESLGYISLTFLSAFFLHILSDLASRGTVVTLSLAARGWIEISISVLILTGILLTLRSSRTRLGPRLYNRATLGAELLVSLELFVVLISFFHGSPSPVPLAASFLKAITSLTSLLIVMQSSVEDTYMSLLRKYKDTQLALMNRINELRKARADRDKLEEYCKNLFDEFPAPLRRSGPDGKFAGYMAPYFDVTEIRKSESALKLTEYSLDNSCICTLWITSDGSFLNANKAACDLLGYSKDQLLQMKIWQIDETLVGDSWERQWHQLKSAGHMSLETSHKTNGGMIIPVEVHHNYLKYGDLECDLLFVHDITDRKRVEEEIRFLTFHDRLTGLYNRAYFEEELARLDTERQLPLSIVVGDVNGLRLINDTLGREVGNAHLVQIAQTIKQVCRKEDIVARWGGDEFAILLPKTGEKTAHEVCLRIVEACKANSTGHLKLSIALGYGTKTDRSQSIHEILSTAESWMYRQKFLDRASYRNALISSLRQTLNAKTHETYEHTMRLEKLALMVGRAMNLSARELDDLALLAALHDIGKVGIPDHILNKPGELTPDEWEIMKTHAEIGHRIASSSPDLVHIAEAILSHHEKWDGSGYPRGLKGKEIPLIARILAVVDAYDAMINDRPHSAARSHEEALQELKRCAHTHFDPDLVDVFVRLVSTKRIGDPPAGRTAC